MGIKERIKKAVNALIEKEPEYKRPEKGEKRIDHSKEKQKAIEKAWKKKK